MGVTKTDYMRGMDKFFGGAIKSKAENSTVNIFIQELLQYRFRLANLNSPRKNFRGLFKKQGLKQIDSCQTISFVLYYRWVQIKIPFMRYDRAFRISVSS